MTQTSVTRSQSAARQVALYPAASVESPPTVVDVEGFRPDGSRAFLGSKYFPQEYRFLIDFMGNSWVKSGYRIHYRTHGQCLRSMFSLTNHNQMLNFWTMPPVLLIGCIGFWYTFTHGPLSWSSITSTAASGPIALLLAVVLHTPLSMAFHAFGCLSPRHHVTYQGYDMASIFSSSCLVSYAIGIAGWHRASSATILALACGVFALPMFFLSLTGMQQSLSKVQRSVPLAVTGMFFFLPMITSSVQLGRSLWRHRAAGAAATSTMTAALHRIGLLFTASPLPSDRCALIPRRPDGALSATPEQVIAISCASMFFLLCSMMAYVAKVPERFLPHVDLSSGLRSHVWAHIFYAIAYGFMWMFVVAMLPTDVEW